MDGTLRLKVGFLVSALTLGGTVGCSDDSAQKGPKGGPVEGAADAHCGAKKQRTTQAACTAAAEGDRATPRHGGGGEGEGGHGAGGHGEGGHAHEDEGDEYGESLFNTEGDDDECKYHVTWSSTDIYENTDVSFMLTVTRKEDGKPATGAKPLAEVFLNEVHPAPNTDQRFTETEGGTYTIGPIQYDEKGKWTTRFHFYDTCVDGEESPHGHIAFLVNVP